MPEARPQARVPPDHRLQRGLQHRSIERALELKLKLHRIDVRRPAHRTAHGTAVPPAAATAAGCPRSADNGRSSRSISPCVRSTSATSLGLSPPAPGCAACRTSAVKRPQPASAPDRAPPPHRAAPGPASSSPSARGPSAPSSVSALISIDMRKRHRRIAAAAAAPRRRRLLAGISAGAQSAPAPPAANRPR